MHIHRTMPVKKMEPPVNKRFARFHPPEAVQYLQVLSQALPSIILLSSLARKFPVKFFETLKGSENNPIELFPG